MDSLLNPTCELTYIENNERSKRTSKPLIRKESTFATIESYSTEHRSIEERIAKEERSEDQRILEQLIQDERLLSAARHLRRILTEEQNANTIASIEREYKTVLDKAEDFERSIADLLDDPDSSWKKQGESRGGKYGTLIYYKIVEESKLFCRIETPIEASLLVPLLSVLNEVDLYSLWIPSWNLPRIGVKLCRQIQQHSRADQTVQVQCDVPWPFGTREVILRAIAVDDIEDSNFVAVRLKSLTESDEGVPRKESNVERIDFDGVLLFRACPAKHSTLQSSKTRHNSEPLVLVSFKMFLDPKMTGIPPSLINFVTRTVIGSMWSMLLKVAEDVRDGTKRPEHCAEIEAKAEFYKWVESRINVMLNNMNLEEQEKFISYLQS